MSRKTERWEDSPVVCRRKAERGTRQLGAGTRGGAGTWRRCTTADAAGSRSEAAWKRRGGAHCARRGGRGAGGWSGRKMTFQKAMPQKARLPAPVAQQRRADGADRRPYAGSLVGHVPADRHAERGAALCVPRGRCVGRLPAARSRDAGRLPAFAFSSDAVCPPLLRRARAHTPPRLSSQSRVTCARTKPDARDPSLKRRPRAHGGRLRAGPRNRRASTETFSGASDDRHSTPRHTDDASKEPWCRPSPGR